MKVFTYVPKIYEPLHPAYQNDKSGLALYVHDIVTSLATQAEVSVLTQQISSGGNVSGVTYLRNTKKQILLQAKPRAYRRAFHQFFVAKGGFKKRIKRAFLAIEVSRFEQVLKDTAPDVVNIHGCNPEIFHQIEACQNNHIPFVISLHGLIGLDESVNATAELKDIERLVLQRGDEAQWPIVAISNGVKNRAVDYYHLKHPENISVILNGTNVEVQEKRTSSEFESWFQRVNPNGKKIVLCVGAISRRKNQAAVVEAWSRLPLEIRDRHMVLFLGNDLINGAVQRKIEEYQLQDSMHVCGHLEKEMLNCLYERASLNVLASIDEGFGLSLIEAMYHGVPSVTFADLDAVPDLYDPDVMVLPEARSTECLAAAIQQAINRKWNRQRIVEKAERYSMQHVTEQYLALYRKLMG